MEVLDSAIANDDRVTIKSVLVDAVPESVVGTSRSAPPRKPEHYPRYRNSACGKQR